MVYDFFKKVLTLWVKIDFPERDAGSCLDPSACSLQTALPMPSTRLLFLTLALTLCYATVWAERGNGLAINRFAVEFRTGTGGHISETDLRVHPFQLSRSDVGHFVARREGREENEVVFTLNDFPGGVVSLDGLIDLQNQAVSFFNRRGLLGVVVMASPEQVDLRTGQDLRQDDQQLTLEVWVSEVAEVRTIAKGGRIRDDNPINHPRHAWIANRSPVDLDAGEGAVILRPPLNEFLERLNRHPGRRVDVALSSSGEPGKVVLDYLVNETRPWTIYAQVSNTGTRSTGEWRQRFGAVHHQLFGRDDILSLDYLTASFDQANAFLGSYQIPLLRPDYLIWRIFGSYSDFDADNLFVEAAPNFTGETVTYGTELRYTPFYFWGHALSITAGVKWEDIRVENIFGQNEGEADLLSPYLRLSFSRTKRHHRSHLSIGWEHNTRENESGPLTSLGRLATTADHNIFTADFHQSFFVEPLFRGFSRPNPENWRANSLVHELSFSARGQYVSGDDRLIPQKQIFAGGFFSVRGYEESVIAGDSGVIASAEYRLHLARLLRPTSLLEEPPERKDTFWGRINFRAPDLYGLPDWNFLVRGFFDYAALSINDRRPDEIQNTLASVGLGFELQLRSNFNLRVDYGHILRSARRLELPGREPFIEGAEKGDSRVHVLATFAF